MVADKVDVISLKAGEKQAYKWTSDGKSGFELKKDKKKSVGTTVILHLNDEGKEYSNKWQIEQIVKKYSNHIAFPINLTFEEIDYDKEGKEKGKKTDHPVPGKDGVTKGNEEEGAGAVKKSEEEVDPEKEKKRKEELALDEGEGSSRRVVEPDGCKDSGKAFAHPLCIHQARQLFLNCLPLRLTPILPFVSSLSLGLPPLRFSSLLPLLLPHFLWSPHLFRAQGDQSFYLFLFLLYHNQFLQM
jgi:hypothetical protein